MSILYAIGFGEFQWFRRLCGGTWFHVYVDMPVAAWCWLKVPDGSTPFTYSEPLWRGMPIVEDWL